MAKPKSFLADYDSLRSGSGFVELKKWSMVIMTGADRQSFLHNMCTNNIRQLQIGESCEAFCTNVQGKIVAQLFVIAREDRLELLTVPREAETLITHLDRYIVREEVTLTDATDDYCWLFLGGCETLSVLSALSVAPCGFGESLCCFASFARNERQQSQESFEEADWVACCDEAWQAARIEAHLPLFGVDFGNANLPQEVNRNEQTINFDKGCYLGQETIARIDALGHVNQKVVLVQFQGDSTPPVGLELCVADKCVGRVTSGCWSPRSKAPLALAMVRRGSNELGDQLESDLGVATVVAPLEKET